MIFPFPSIWRCHYLDLFNWFICEWRFQFAVWLRFDNPELPIMMALKQALYLMKNRFGNIYVYNFLLLVGILWAF